MISTRGTYVGVQDQQVLFNLIAHKTLNKFSSTKKTCTEVKYKLTEGLGIIMKRRFRLPMMIILEGNRGGIKRWNCGTLFIYCLEQGAKIAEKERFSFVQAAHRFLAHKLRHDHMPVRNHMDNKTLDSLKF